MTRREPPPAGGIGLKVRRAVATLNVAIARGVEGLVFGLMSVMLALLLLQAVGRYLFAYSPAWAGESARYAFVWVTFLGIAVGFRQKRHVSIDFLLQYLSPAIRTVMAAVVHIATVIILIVMTRGGVELTILFVHQTSPAMEISMAWVYSSIVVSGAAMFLFELETLLAAATLGRRAELREITPT